MRGVGWIWGVVEEVEGAGEGRWGSWGWEGGTQGGVWHDGEEDGQHTGFFVFLTSWVFQGGLKKHLSFSENFLYAPELVRVQ